MSKLPMLGLLGLCLAFTACQSRTEIVTDTQESIKQAIATDDIFVEMLKAETGVFAYFHHSKEIAEEFMSRTEVMEDLCALKLDPAVESAATLEFRDYVCTWRNNKVLLREKYAYYRQLQGSQYGDLVRLCHDLTGYDHLQETMNLYLTQK